MAAGEDAHSGVGASVPGGNARDSTTPRQVRGDVDPNPGGTGKAATTVIEPTTVA